ncbi:MAG: hypothetical protein JO051_03460, partial [Acidobacteriaceae bacterium]|nr:hypothetical protein [Acidobacteriaceae bacterium]
MLDIFTTAQQDQNDALARNAAAAPNVGVMPTFGQAYNAAREENLRYDDLFAQGRNEYDFVQQSLDHYAGQTGETLPNPMVPTPGGNGARLDSVRQKFIDKARTTDGPSLSFPSDDEIRAGGIALGRQARRAAAQASQGPSGPGALAGNIAAGLVSSTTDPLNAISLALAPEGGSLLMGALKMGGAFAAQQAVTEATTYNYQQAVNPEHGVGEALGSVLEAAPMGFLQEAGLRGLGMGWRKLRGARPDVAAALPLDVRDAGNVAEKAEDLQAQNPFKGFSGEAAHSEAVGKVEADLLAGNKVELPQAAVDEAAVRRGQVFYPGGSISARYDLAELSDLVTSHDRDFNVNPAYPAELQPRDRAGAPARDQVQSIYSNLEPERLGPSPEANAGAPIVGPDGVVESGNGRVLALAKAYEAGGDQAAAYRAWLEGQGLDASNYRQPVMVGVRETAMSAEQRANFAHAANGSASLRMNAVEQAMSDARMLSGDVLDRLQGSDLNAASNR